MLTLLVDEVSGAATWRPPIVCRVERTHKASNTICSPTTPGKQGTLP